jgi:hypothetical protein
MISDKCPYSVKTIFLFNNKCVIPENGILIDLMRSRHTEEQQETTTRLRLMIGHTICKGKPPATSLSEQPPD